MATRVDDGVVAVPDAMTEQVLAQELPDVLHWVQLGRVAGQREQADVLGQVQPG